MGRDQLSAGLVILVFAHLTGCAAPISDAASRQFQEAQAAFDQARAPEEYLRVAAMYQQLVQSGVQSGAVWYNQGNAYLRGGQRARAIACYRQAQRYRPRDPQLDANLRFARGENQPAATPRPLVEYLLFWQNWVSYPGKFQLSVICGATALAFGLASLRLPSSRWRWLAAAALLVTLAASGSAAYDWYRYEVLEHGVVLQSGVVARKGDSASYEPAFTAALEEGMEVLVIDQRRDWVKVRLSGGLEGWIPSAEVVRY